MATTGSFRTSVDFVSVLLSFSHSRCLWSRLRPASGGVEFRRPIALLVRVGSVVCQVNIAFHFATECGGGRLAGKRKFG